MMKEDRQLRILEIIKENKITTQKGLAQYLRKEGFDITQATVSRDIKELKLSKVADEDGSYHYALPEEKKIVNELRAGLIFRGTINNVEKADNLIVVKTIPGNAQGVCAVIDEFQWEEVVGTIAGEDTILVIARSRESTDIIIKKINRVLR